MVAGRIGNKGLKKKKSTFTFPETASDGLLISLLLHHTYMHKSSITHYDDYQLENIRIQV